MTFLQATSLLLTLMAVCIAGDAHGQSKPVEASKQEGSPASTADSHAAGASTQDGAAIYARYCALCHGADRQGYAADEAPSLRSPQLIGAAPGSYLWTAISYGRPNTAMAAFQDSLGGPLSHDAQHALMDWLIEESGL